MKNWRGRNWLILLPAVGGLLISWGCGRESEGSGAGSAAAKIKVGEFASLTGKEAAFGQSSDKGTVLAVEEINAGGGVLAKPIDLITEDDQSKPGEAATSILNAALTTQRRGRTGSQDGHESNPWLWCWLRMWRKCSRTGSQ